MNTTALLPAGGPNTPFRRLSILESGVAVVLEVVQAREVGLSVTVLLIFWG